MCVEIEMSKPSAPKGQQKVRSQVWVTLFVPRLGDTPGSSPAWGVSKLGDTLGSGVAELGMPWREEKGSQEQRENFVKEAFGGEKAFRELCREYRISRKTGYKWRKRAVEEGTEALKDRKRGPQENSHYRIEPNWILRILEQKKTSQLGIEKALCPLVAVTSWRKAAFANEYQPDPERLWLSTESNQAAQQAWSSATQARASRAGVV
jgi:transposase-like protein